MQAACCHHQLSLQHATALAHTAARPQRTRRRAAAQPPLWATGPATLWAGLSQKELERFQAELQGVQVPNHLAVIMDGNARWARARGLPITVGHESGAARFKELVQASKALNLKALTVFAFSQENWKRSEQEINFIFQTISSLLDAELDELIRQGIRLDLAGELTRLPTWLQEQLYSAQRATSENTDCILTVALSYSSQQDIAGAARKLASLAAQGQLDPDQIDANLLQDHLTTSLVLSNVGPPDLLIRSSGEQRLSNFLLFEAAYTELYFSKVPWPDFSLAELADATREYSHRQRRYGGRPACD